jgi:putative Holliday junction resolvase
MSILGIDYGRKKIGLAIADGPIAVPYKVIRYQDIKTLADLIKKEGIKEIVIGISEGKMRKEAERFGRSLKKKFGLPVYFQDETLTTVKAKELALKAGIKRKKRKKLEDAYSATLILQDYLDLK